MPLSTWPDRGLCVCFLHQLLRYALRLNRRVCLYKGLRPILADS